jgi:acyl carrier protein
MGITDEGMILAYKRVREDYMDIHSGTIRNAVGDSPSMPRNKVDENKDRTCSDGLHFCSFSYLPHFGSGPGSKVVILEIHPKDVVAIPSDYNDAKGRTCAYTVIGEYQGDDINDILSAKPVWKPNDVRSNFGNADYRRAEQSVLERFLDALRDNDARGDLNDAPIDGDTTLGELPYAVRAQIVRIVDEDFGGSYEIDDYLLSDDDLTLGEIAEMTRDGGNERDENEDEDWDGDTDESEGTDASIEARVVRILSDHMGVGTSQITPDSKIMDDLGADSLDIVELIMAFEEDFNVDISDADADSILTVRDLVAGLENLTTGQPVVPVMSANPTPAASGQTTVFIYPETDGNETRWIAECADCNGGKGWKQRYARKRDARRGIRRSLGENVAIIERDL